MMQTLDKNVFGYWEITEIRFLNDEKKWEKEELLGGSTVILPTGNLLTYTKTVDLPFGYSGTFKAEGNRLIIIPKVCTIPEMEGKVTIRTVEKVSESSLVLGSLDQATGRTYEFEFKLISRSFQ